METSQLLMLQIRKGFSKVQTTVTWFEHDFLSAGSERIHASLSMRNNKLKPAWITNKLIMFCFIEFFS